MLLHLALNHTIIIDARNGKYSSSSPDELALVKAAKQFGFEFMERDPDDNVLIRDIKNNKTLRY